MSRTGASSPLSSSSTLADTSILKEKQEQLVGSFLSPSTPPQAAVIAKAATVVESLASKHSKTVFAYDTAVQSGLGALTKQWSQTGVGAQYVEMQNRNGSGLILAGCLGQGSSSQSETNGTLSVYVTPEGLGQMGPSLAHLPAPTVNARVVIQVPAVSVVEPSLALTPGLGSLLSTLSSLPSNFAVIFSSSAEEIADIASLSYGISDSHVVHVFNQFSAAREFRRISYPASLPAPTTVEEALVGSGYSFFEYHGSPTAEVVFVTLQGALASVLDTVATSFTNVGVISVRLLRPWLAEAFQKVVPASVKSIYVLEDALQASQAGPLFEDVFASTLDLSSRPATHHYPLTPSRVLELVSSPEELQSVIATLSNSKPTGSLNSLTPATLKKLVFYGTPSTSLLSLPSVISNSFITTPAIQTRLLTDYDAFSKPGGLSVSRLFLTNEDETSADLSSDILLPHSSSEGSADFVAVMDHTLLKTHNVFASVRPKGLVLVYSSWSTDELVSTLPAASAKVVREKQLAVYALNTRSVAGELLGSEPEGKQVMEVVLAHLAFLRLYVGVSCTLESLEKVARGLFGEAVEGIEIAKVVAHLWPQIFGVAVPDPAEPATDAPVPAPLKNFEFNSVDVESFQGLEAEGEEVSSLGTWRDAAKQLIFREAFHLPRLDSLNPFQQNPLLRPDLEDRTFLVTCSVNRRLTPLTYDRNVFHLEFDTVGTGLKYEIGEALGVHGWNDEQEVLDFCSWYGLDTGAVVSIPVPSANRGSGKRHSRTVFQALQQQIDIFGRPPKSFYSALAEYAQSREHRMALRFIGAAEGSATFKKLSEVDTVTFADVLRMYDSARPDFAVLCDLVGDIKPRHYSIASAQSAVGDRVDLLVVTVDWLTPSGSPRFGQCTRYLAGLKPGQKVTVSIKPSVMKLPPDNLQPIIMAGLGTGAAPFRAFIQHRAHLAAQGIPIGPLIYYFGSRHRSQEYLYGEELEAYIAEGIITHAGFAFSRDQKKKIYIQHKMLEDGPTLAAMLAGKEQKGVFYLCGPTWPVPDVYEALLGALGEHAGYTREAAMQYLEDLKEEERYVLEVY